MYRFGRRVADHIIEREWLKEMAVSTRDNPEATLVKSIAVHARYLVGLGQARAMYHWQRRSADPDVPAYSSLSHHKTRNLKSRSGTSRQSLPSTRSLIRMRSSSYGQLGAD